MNMYFNWEYVCLYWFLAGDHGTQDDSQSLKHMLTPESKIVAKSVPKRFAAIPHHGRF